MGITMQHGPSPGLIGAAAMKAGNLARDERDLDRAREDTRTAAQLALSYDQLASRNIGTERARLTQAALRMMDLENRRSYQGQMFESRALDREAMQKRAELAADTSLFATVQRGLADGTMHYTPAQLRQLAKWEADLATVQNDGWFGEPGQGQERRDFVAGRLRDQIRRLRMSPVPTSPEQQKVEPIDEFIGNTFTGQAVADKLQLSADSPLRQSLAKYIINGMPKRDGGIDYKALEFPETQQDKLELARAKEEAAAKVKAETERAAVAEKQRVEQLKQDEIYRKEIMHPTSVGILHQAGTGPTCLDGDSAAAAAAAAAAGATASAAGDLPTGCDHLADGPGDAAGCSAGRPRTLGRWGWV
jgi:hypothetical protein